MTCREKLKITHPELVSERFTGGCDRCPEFFFDIGIPDYCKCNDEACRRCWDRELSEKENMIMNNRRIVTLENLNLYSETINGARRWYLKAVYRIESADEIREVTFPKIALPIAEDLPLRTFNLHEEHIDLGFGELLLCKSSAGYTYKEKMIKRKMSVEEIEKALGYTVEIVNKKKGG